MMLSSEQTSVMIAHMRNSLMSKAAHVRYTAEKCFNLREHMLCSAGQCREHAGQLSPLQNKQYSLMGNILRDGEDKKEKAQENRLLTLVQEQYRMSGLIELQLGSVASGLMRSADALLFSLLKAQHYQWRDRLYMAVLAGEAADVMSKETECPLGHWLHGEGALRFKGLPGYRELNDCHHEMHTVAEALFTRLLAAMPATGLEQLLQGVEDVSQRLIVALECLDNRVALLYPENVG
ncbi:CZB domain-containing protein [Citrobacter arsenatis]|uniref:CZB domain-containing protein n=1 Tax=Citrobacter arsenatis TaxID=2546350 RepID=UPI00300DCA48